MQMLIHKILLIAGIIFFSLANTTIFADADPRHRLAIIPYKAVTEEAEKHAFADFQVLMIRSLSNKGDQIYGRLIDAAVEDEKSSTDKAGRIDDLERFHYLEDLQEAKPRKELLDASSSRFIKKYIDNWGLLAVLTGDALKSDQHIHFTSKIHVGERLGAFTKESFKVSYIWEPGNVEQEAISAFENAHLFYFLYALVKDAVRDDFPPWTKNELLKEAEFTLKNLDSETQAKYAPMLQQIFEALKNAK